MTRATLAITLVALLAACGNPRRDEAVGAMPASLEEAARALTWELTHDGVHVRGAHATVTELLWECDVTGEPAPPPRAQNEWVSSTLVFAEIAAVEAVSPDARGWLVLVRAPAGAVRLWFKTRDSALRARGALLKLAHR